MYAKIPTYKRKGRTENLFYVTHRLCLYCTIIIVFKQYTNHIKQINQGNLPICFEKIKKYNNLIKLHSKNLKRRFPFKYLCFVNSAVYGNFRKQWFAQNINKRLILNSFWTCINTTFTFKINQSTNLYDVKVLRDSNTNVSKSLDVYSTTQYKYFHIRKLRFCFPYSYYTQSISRHNKTCEVSFTILRKKVLIVWLRLKPTTTTY